MKVLVSNITENTDGTVNITIEYDNEFTKMVREYYNKTRCSQKMIRKFVIEGLTNYLDKQGVE